MIKENEKKNNTQLMSLIIPVYNVQDYVKACLLSVTKQTYSNLEIIIVDDGSTDESGKICDEFADKDKRIKVIHKENGGLSSARNAGTDVAEGDFFCYIDSDDAIAPDFVEKLYNICIKENCEMAVSGICFVNSKENETVKTVSLDNNTIKVVSGIDLLRDFYGENHITITVAWNKMYSRELIGDIRYPEGRIHEDEATTFKFLYNAKRVGWTDEKLYNYTIRSGSIMKSGFNPKRLQILDAYADRKSFYKEYAKKGEREAEFFLIREEYCYLSEILLLYGKVKKNMPDRSDLSKGLVDKYRREYKDCNRQKWNAKRKLFYLISYFIPGLYYGIKNHSR